MSFMDRLKDLEGAAKDNPFCIMCGKPLTSCNQTNTCEMSPLYQLGDNEYRAYRLQQLREEFEAKRDKLVIIPQVNGFSILSATDRDCLRKQSVDDLATGLFPAAIVIFHRGGLEPPADLVDAARHYIIARDFNEFDPDKADMLWKLQRQ